ncbi:DUF1840 family protein [Kerstersia similis]|uniref:DUF1840 family protein n=1 Tax=Kerstersia similis TaxID=206505 RepID=UPI0039EE7BD0
MLVTFQSKAASDVLMLDKHALEVLQAAGRQVSDADLKRGVFSVEQLPGAIAALEAAIAAETPAPESEDPDKEPVHPLAQTVHLKQRAFPLLDMLRKARDTEVPVLWEAGSAW